MLLCSQVPTTDSYLMFDETNPPSHISSLSYTLQYYLHSCYNACPVFPFISPIKACTRFSSPLCVLQLIRVPRHIISDHPRSVMCCNILLCIALHSNTLLLNTILLLQGYENVVYFLHSFRITQHTNPLQTKRRLPDLKTKSVPRSKHFSSQL